jgi:hypothetical protein
MSRRPILSLQWAIGKLGRQSRNLRVGCHSTTVGRIGVNSTLQHFLSGKAIWRQLKMTTPSCAVVRARLGDSSLRSNCPEHLCNVVVTFLLRYLVKSPAFWRANHVICFAFKQKPDHVWFIARHCEG